jgi:high affinity Mn2+ porin
MTLLRVLFICLISCCLFAEDDTDNLKISGNLTSIVQGTSESNLWGGSHEEAVGASYQANITLDNEFEAINGKAKANIQIGNGTGVEDQLTLYSNVNAKKCEEFTISTIYYEQRLCNNKLTINFGKLSPTDFFDQNQYAGSSSTQFLGKIFNNSSVIEFPSKSGGIRLGADPYDWLEVGYLVMGGKPSMSKITTDLFHIGKVIFKPYIKERFGNYRLMAWYNSTDHTTWTDQFKDTEHNYGLALSLDQELTENIGVFGKFGWQNPNRYDPTRTAYVDEDTTNVNAKYFSPNYMWSTGLNLNGSLWHRYRDNCGVGVGQVLPPKEMRQTLDRKGLAEAHLEAYYNVYINPYLSITPGVQYIRNSYGRDIPDANDNIAIYYLRAHVDF